MAKIWFQSGTKSLGARELNWGRTRVGRERDNDIVIDHPSVSAHHCEFILGLDFVEVRDAGSTNGTFIDGQLVQQARLRPENVLRFGDIEARVEWSQEVVTVPPIYIPKQRHSVTLADGTVSCVNHPQVRATRRCPRCRKMFCDRCIHNLHFKGSADHNFCPTCSAETELVIWGDGGARKKTWWGRIKGVFGSWKS